jgi:hypothetical protein
MQLKSEERDSDIIPTIQSVKFIDLDLIQVNFTLPPGTE